MVHRIDLGANSYIEWDGRTHEVRYCFHSGGTSFWSKTWVRRDAEGFARYLASGYRSRGIDVTPGKDTHTGWENA